MQNAAFDCADHHRRDPHERVRVLPGDFVHVTSTATYQPIIALLGFLGTFHVRASSTVQIRN